MSYKKAAPIKLIVEQIKATHGNLAAVGRSLGVTREAIRQRVANSVEAQNALQEARQTMLDDAENTLYERALAGNTAELIFFLKTQGKSRGYIERQEVISEPDDDATDIHATIQRKLDRVRNARGADSVRPKLVS